MTTRIQILALTMATTLAVYITMAAHYLFGVMAGNTSVLIFGLSGLSLWYAISKLPKEVS